ncbi:ribulose-bisphosphate carboxylase large subunit family protein [Cohnella ginsengisoli]|uniref:Ribulose-bisphosphate carboxylase large subunit family protein n=1 Tax=Cohnella ginsengisoli TaxID=425004 RepID=A0A9X4QLG0_9BACL|nr:ribulose-bisphosphate carboxylase large subunit family protein [Cohnella ginsengisoli]MDG0790176.1 ribulose-bisphosphate carboxylase large subunit family protein [Cohnella ginsengisoli]
MSGERDVVRSTYLIETPHALGRAAEVMAGEQSTGTFVAVPGETDEVKARSAARIVGIEELEPVREPSLPGAKPPKEWDGLYRRGRVTLEFPMHNFGPSIPNLMATVAGNLYELQEFSGLRLLDLELPEAFCRRYRGPKFGVEGTRRLAGVLGRPIIGTIVKPSIGLTVEELRLLVRELADAGLDFIKDDELNASPTFAPIEDKVKAVMEEIERAADRTGKKVMYAFNITGDIDELKRRHDLVCAHGGTCIMVSIQSIGLAGLAHLNGYSELPIHGHRNQWGMMTRSPALGMEFAAYQKLCRLAGADHLHVNALDSKFYESNESVIRSVRALREPFAGGAHACMPVLSSGQSAATAERTYRQLGTYDLMNIAGGGIMAHPDGPAAGVRSMQQAWEAAIAGIPRETYAERHAELRRALETFSRSG